GAHGGAGTYFINMNPQTGKEVKLDDILKSGYANVLLKEGEKAFRMVRDLADTTSFYDYGFEFPDNKFQLNDNYGFIQEGIVFFYNRYEIAPYAAGPTQIVIPYEKLRGWLK
ncbi:MAG: RsiV family protein, partial [Bacteroidota bacterium]